MGRDRPTLKVAIDKDTGRRVKIDDAASGKACNCICPFCHNDVGARKCKDKQSSFFHLKGECGFTYEQSLHYMAETELLEIKYIWLPPYKTIIGETGKDWIKVPIDKVYQEKSYGDNKPDIVIETNGVEIKIEVLVTHRVDDAKIYKLRRDKISTLEIDLSKLDRYNIDFDNLREVLVGKNEHKYWVYNKVADAFNKDFIEKHLLKADGKGVINCPLKIRMNKYGYYYATTCKDCHYCKFNCANKEEFKELFWQELNALNFLEEEVRCGRRKQEELDNFKKNMTYKKLIDNQSSVVVCMGTDLITEYSDYKLSMEERLDKYKWDIDNAKRCICNGICPQCANSSLAERVNKTTGELFIACEDYECNFTMGVAKFENLQKTFYKELSDKRNLGEIVNAVRPAYQYRYGPRRKVR